MSVCVTATERKRALSLSLSLSQVSYHPLVRMITLAPRVVELYCEEGTDVLPTLKCNDLSCC